MTYMYEYPNYQKFSVPSADHNNSFKYYGLYRYYEGRENNKLQGNPVLFIPGNSGSYRQVRSLASVSRQISLKHHEHQIFDYFSVDLNEELSFASGTITDQQVSFVALAILRIHELYGNKTSLILIGHSMGGFVARAVLMNPALDANFVSMIIGLASPLELPVAGLDTELVHMYGRVNEFWKERNGLDHLFLVSLTGGNRDTLVWDGYGYPRFARHSLWLPTVSIPSVGVSTDHLCIVWCRQNILFLNRALYSLINQTGRFSTDPVAAMSAFKSNLNTDTRCREPVIGSVSSYSFLLYKRFQISVHNSTGFCLTLPALAHVTRPLRLQVVPSVCSSTNIYVRLISSYVGHSHQLDIRNDQSLLLSMSLKANSNSLPMLQFQMPHDCQLQVTIEASAMDWVATLIRIHSGRLPSFISAILVLDLFNSGSIHLLSIVGLSYSGITIQSTGLGYFYELGIIDMWDVIFLFVLSLPFVQIIRFFSVLLISSISRIMSFIPSFTVSTFQCLFFLFIVMVITPHCPVVATFFLFIIHLITVASKNDHYQPIFLESRISTILLTNCLWQLAPSLAYWHSIKQDNSLDKRFHNWLDGLVHFSGYRFSLTMALLCISIMRVDKIQKEKILFSKSYRNMYWIISVVLATCCVTQGALDIFQCTTYFIIAIFVAKVSNLFIYLKH